MKKSVAVMIASMTMHGMWGMNVWAAGDIPIADSKIDLMNYEYEIAEVSVSAALPESGVYLVGDGNMSITDCEVVSITDGTADFITELSNHEFDSNGIATIGIYKMLAPEECSFSITCDPLTVDESGWSLSSELVADIDSDIIVATSFITGEGDEKHYIQLGENGKLTIGRALTDREYYNGVETNTEFHIDGIYVLSDHLKSEEFNYADANIAEYADVSAILNNEMTGIAVLTVENETNERKFATPVNNSSFIFYSNLVWPPVEDTGYSLNSVEIAEPNYLIQIHRDELGIVEVDAEQDSEIEAALQKTETEVTTETVDEESMAVYVDSLTGQEIKYNPEEDIEDMRSAKEGVMMVLFQDGYITMEEYNDNYSGDELSQEIRDALTEFQKDKGLTANGYCNVETFMTIFEEMQVIVENM